MQTDTGACVHYSVHKRRRLEQVNRNYYRKQKNSVVTKMPRYCCVSGCYTKGGSGIPLYTFKKDWLALAKWKNSSPKSICGLHFEKNIICEKRKRNKLTQQCKPTIFPSSHICLHYPPLSRVHRC